MTLVAGTAAWTCLTSVRAGGRPGLPAALLLGCALVWILGGRVARVAPALPALLVAGAGVAMVVVAVASRLNPLMARVPMGYANALAAFILQAEVAALMLAAFAKGQASRVASGGLAIVFALFLPAFGSAAGTFLSAGILATGLATWRGVGARVLSRAWAFCLWLALAATLAIAAVGPSFPLSSEILSPRRPILWNEAFTLMSDRPLWGYGPGQFAVRSPTARSDPNARWAHHEFLQVGAESGVLGLALAISLFLWVLARIRVPPGRERGRTYARVAVLGATAVSVLGIHATIDYILHFPAVPIAAAALGGASVSCRAATRLGARRYDS